MWWETEDRWGYIFIFSDQVSMSSWHFVSLGAGWRVLQQLITLSRFLDTRGLSSWRPQTDLEAGSGRSGMRMGSCLRRALRPSDLQDISEQTPWHRSITLTSQTPYDQWPTVIRPPPTGWSSWTRNFTNFQTVSNPCSTLYLHSLDPWQCLPSQIYPHHVSRLQLVFFLLKYFQIKIISVWRHEFAWVC